jgi:hypothetical protein
MSNFFIGSKLGGNLVIDIQKAGTTPGTPLDVYPQKMSAPGWDNQLWEWVASGNPGWYALQNPASGLAIEVRGASTTPGTLLDAGTLSIGKQNQLWAFMPSAGYYFITSKLGNLVIDVQKARTIPGTLLDAWPQKTNNQEWNNQLWTFVGEDGNSVMPPPPPPQTAIK